MQTNLILMIPWLLFPAGRYFVKRGLLKKFTIIGTTSQKAIFLRSGWIIMIEPWINRWSLWVYSNLHHEVIDISTDSWSFTSSGPLSGANQALP